MAYFMKILWFELNYKFRQPFTYVFWLLLFIQGVWYLESTANIYYNDRAYVNSGANIYIILSSLGIIGIVLASINTANSLYKDVEYRFASVIYTSRVGEGSLFWGRFVATLLLNMFVFTGYVAGAAALPMLGMGDPANYGPIPWWQLGWGTVVFLLPVLFSMTAMAYAFTVFIRKPVGAYLAAFIYMAGMVFAESNRETAINKELLFLLDPFGFAYILDKVDGLGALQKNNYRLPLEPVIIYSRILWVGLASMVLAAARWRFGFTYFLQGKGRPAAKRRRIDEPTATQRTGQTISPVNLHFSNATHFKRMCRLAVFESRSIIKSWGFVLLSALTLLMFMGYNLVWTEQYYSQTPQLPLTQVMTYIRKPVGFMLTIMLMVYAGELYYKDRSSNMWQITDALPSPTWVTMLSRFGAMIIVALVIQLLFIVAGVSAQVLRSYYHFDWNVYLVDVVFTTMPRYLAAIALALFIGSVVNNRYVGHAVSIAVYLFFIVVHELEISNQTRFQFTLTPAFTYSEMNGHGHYLIGEYSFLGYWLAWGAIMLSLGTLWWNRGIGQSLLSRIRSAWTGVNTGLYVGLVVSIITLFATHQYIYHNINELNHFKTLQEEHIQAALYEKRYKRYETYPQPKISHVELLVELYPGARKATYSVGLVLANRSNETIDTLHVEYKDFSSILTATSEGIPLVVLGDEAEDLRHVMYRLPHQLHPGDSVSVRFDMEMNYRGFAEHTVDQTDLVYNGSFLGPDLLPYIGYDEDRELQADQYRRRYGLAALGSRLPIGDSDEVNMRHYSGKQADRLTYRVVVGTDGGQVPVAAGKILRRWNEGGRDYAEFKSEGRGLYELYIASGRYAHRESKWRDEATGREVILHSYFHPSHTWNVDLFEESARNMLDYGSRQFGAYPYSSLSLVEIPQYHKTPVAFDNVIAIPENQGWTADSRRKHDADYIQYLMAEHVSKHWFRQAGIQHALGYPLITESMPAYLALSMFEQLYGASILSGHLTKRRDGYITGRGREANQEPVLAATDESAYVARDKGALVLFSLAKLIGAVQLDSLIAGFINHEQQAVTSPYRDPMEFYRTLQVHMPDSLQGVLADWMQRRTSYDFGIIDAESEATSDGYVTKLVLTATKWYDEHGDGNLTEVKPNDLYVPIQLYDIQGEILYEQIHRIDGGHLIIRTVTRPDWVSVDGYGYLLDINRRNNKADVRALTE